MTVHFSSETKTAHSRGNHAIKKNTLHHSALLPPSKSYSLIEKLVRLVRMCNWATHTGKEFHVCMEGWVWWLWLLWSFGHCCLKRNHSKREAHLSWRQHFFCFSQTDHRDNTTDLTFIPINSKNIKKNTETAVVKELKGTLVPWYIFIGLEVLHSSIIYAVLESSFRKMSCTEEST